MVLARPFLKDPLAVQAKLCRRMERFIKELFVFVSDPAVPSDKQRRRAEPAASGNQSQDQRRHPLRAGHRQQDDLGIPLWHLADQRSQSPPGMPPVAHFPSTLNSFVHDLAVEDGAGDELAASLALHEIPVGVDEGYLIAGRGLGLDDPAGRDRQQRR